MHDLVCNRENCVFRLTEIHVVYDLAGVWTEVLDDEVDDDRGPVVRILFPRQPDAGLSDVADGGLRRWSGVGGRLRCPMENDVMVGGCLNNKSGTPRRLARVAQSLACVPSSVTLAQLCVTITSTSDGQLTTIHKNVIIELISSSQSRVQFKLCCIMHSVFHGTCPAYLLSLIHI